MASPVKATFDIETNGLLNDSTIDYSSIPYKLKDSFKLHCIVVEWDGNIVAFHDGEKFIFDGREHHIVNEKGEVIFLLKEYTPVDYVHRPLADFMKFVDWLPEGSTVIGHNIINFDLLVLKLVFGLDYIVEKDMDWKAPLGDDYWGDKKVIFDDTMVRSKTLNPDRFGGHSLEKLAENLSFQKFDFRPSVPKEEKFEIFGADMVYYNIFDVLSNKAVAKKLDEEMKDFGWEDKWNPAIKLEKAVAELITRQEHRGFSFDKDLAERNVEELDRLMEERRKLIEPLIPPRPATKSFMKHYTPPKVQFKKADGKPSANLLKFVNKLGATLVEDSVMVWEGKEYQLPLPQEPLVTTMPVTLNDTTHIKEWLVGLGWQPLEYKERDLTLDSKKNKLEGERLRAAVDRYLEQTLQSNFWKDRLEHFGLSAKNAKEGVKKLRKEIDRRLERRRGGVKVLTNPSFTVGVDKEICPNLEKLSEQREDLACILQVSEYLTYRHRRNSILGGGADWDEDEEHEKGYVTAVRSDGRIPTPADTCGAGTSRFKHRLVVNVPRSSSLFGDKMRAMFKADDKVAFQLGYDFSSLEARIEGHYCWSFETTDEKEYCHSLTLEKPNDVHSVMARRVSDIVGFNFERTPAKSTKYCLTYGGGPPKVAKIIGRSEHYGKMVSDAFWEAAWPLASLKEYMVEVWKRYDRKKIVGIDGRLIPTRSEHALVNSLFQSGGVICAKRTMVLHDRYLSEENLLVDFFKDVLDERHWAQQMIAMHDEAQMEVSKKSVKFERFSTEEEAKSFKDKEEAKGRIWSDVQESPKGGFFLAYCLAGELISKAVSQVTSDFKLNVPLEAGYMLGKSWDDCH